MKERNVGFKSFVVWVKPMSVKVFEHSSAHSDNFKPCAFIHYASSAYERN